MDQFEKYLKFQKEVAQATLKIVERFQQSGKERPKKRTPNIVIVLDVLQSARRPLHVTARSHGI